MQITLLLFLLLINPH